MTGLGTAWTEFAWRDGGLFLSRATLTRRHSRAEADGTTWSLGFEPIYLREH